MKQLDIYDVLTKKFKIDKTNSVRLFEAFAENSIVVNVKEME